MQRAAQTLQNGDLVAIRLVQPFYFFLLTQSGKDKTQIHMHTSQSSIRTIRLYLLLCEFLCVHPVHNSHSTEVICQDDISGTTERHQIFFSSVHPSAPNGFKLLSVELDRSFHHFFCGVLAVRACGVHVEVTLDHADFN